MTRRYKRVFFVLLILALSGFLVACATQERITRTPTLASANLTITPIPSTLTNTPQPKFTATITSTPTPPVIAAAYNLPDWFHNFENTILMMITNITDNANQVSFLNANSQEHYDISIPIAQISHYFWMTDGKSFGFLSRDLSSVFIVDTLTGFVKRYPIEGKAADCLHDYLKDRGPKNDTILQFMKVFDTSPDSERFFCEPARIPEDLTVSYQGNYSFPMAWSPDRTRVLVGSLSPAEKGLLCVVKRYGKKEKCLTAIDPKYYPDGLHLFEWSKDGSQIYYVQRDSSRADLCIYNLLSDVVDCPSKNLAELRSLNIEWYKKSDDEQFFVLSYGSSCDGCDFWGDPSSVVIRRDSTDVYFLGKEINEPNVFYYPFQTILIRPNE